MPLDSGSASPHLPPSRGLVAELLGLFSTLGRHVQGLLALAGVEAKEAAGVYLRVAIAVVVALVLSLFAYLLLLLFVAFLLATVFGWSWMWITLGLGVLHLIGVTVCAFYAKGWLRSPVFSSTSAELRKDFSALKEFKP